MIRKLLARLARDLLLLPIAAFTVYQLLASLPLGIDADAGKTQLSPDIVKELEGDLGLDHRFTTGFLTPWKKLAAGERIGHGGMRFDGWDLSRALAGSMRIGAMGLALALALGVAYAVARVAADKPAVDQSLELVPTLVYGTPSFVIALLIAAQTGIAIGDDRASFEPIAAFVAGLGPAMFLGTILHDALRTEMSRPYVLAALARGRSRTGALIRHALPNAAPALVDSLPPIATSLLAGSFVAEKLFGLSYFGEIYVTAATERHLAIVVVATTTFAAILIAVGMATEVLRLLVDPKARTAAVEDAT